ncbi:ABC transporter ATP-binding protein, partial [Streptomyces sp. NPDC048551]
AARSHEITVVIATHDEETAAAADRTLALLDGRPAGTATAAAGTPRTTEDQAACSLSA